MVALIVISCAWVINPLDAAEVDYHPPKLSIIAEHESLDSVLRHISKAMHITVTMPAGLDKQVSCNIRNMTVQRAFRNLLGDMNYALQWEDGGKRLYGVMVIVAGKESTVVMRPDVVAKDDAISFSEVTMDKDENDLDGNDMNGQQEPDLREKHHEEREHEAVPEKNDTQPLDQDNDEMLRDH